ncbi:MAG: 2-iminoacetate synthase ThiH [Candidatus Omnitrophica bacterium]|jgi:2-iminoacetate synthase|nr:2-iminoacetate synthase ThiH [Candidatus Omnitrophota bacterium]
MSFYAIYQKYKSFDLNNFLLNTKENDIINILKSKRITAEQFLNLLSPLAFKYLEPLAQISHRLTKQYFGKTILLYTPLYLSNYCDNQCLYCGFNTTNNIKRKKLSLAEVEREAQFIAKTGLKHILVLSGESRKITPISYLKDCITILRKYFSSISIEIYPLEEDEYKELIKEGVDGLTIYQEVYDEDIYKKIHLSGPKTDYLFRLDTPERAARAGMRTINIGALLGLNQWEKESFFLGLHAEYLQNEYPGCEISISIPRIRKQVSSFKEPFMVSDKNIVQMIIAMRLFLPRVGISLTTREKAQLRDDIIPLGITKISAGSITSVGGHTLESANNTEQFSILDKRNVTEIKKMLLNKGYQPLFKDWVGVC